MSNSKGFWRIVGYLAFLILFVGLSLSIVPTYATAPVHPEDVARALIAAEDSNNVSASVALFAPDAVVTLGDGSVHDTPVAVRGWQQSLAVGHFRLEPVNMQVNGSIVTWTGDIFHDSFRDIGIAAISGDWRLDIENGKIKTFSFTFTPEAVIALQTGQVAAALLEAEATHDVETAVALFSPDAVVTMPDGTVYNTPDEIRAWQQSLADGHLHVEPVGQLVNGHTITWAGTISLDKYRAMNIAVLGMSTRLDVENGKIATLDSLWTPETDTMLQNLASEATATPEATASS